jgi:hypothetical protein
MKKLSLKIGELRVESFELVENKEPRGTVHAHADTLPLTPCRTQRGTGPCECIFTDPESCEIVCVW